jgi:hypothetical protein
VGFLGNGKIDAQCYRHACECGYGEPRQPTGQGDTPERQSTSTLFR